MRRARATRPASVQPNSAKTQFRKKTYGKPGALFSVNRLPDAEAQQGSLASVSSAERWSGDPEPTNMRRSLKDGGATETCVYMPHLELGVTRQRLSRLTRFLKTITAGRQGQCNQYLRHAL